MVSFRKIGILLLSAMIILSFSTAFADTITDEDLALATQANAGVDLDGELEGWQLIMKNREDEYAAFKEKYAPKVRTLENGVKVQRTPADKNSKNNKLYEADTRGCAACHTDLAVTLRDMKDLGPASGLYFGHHDFTNELGIETTYLQCLSCHDDSFGSLNMELSTAIHTAHRNSAAFDAMGGDCWSCHFVNERNGSFEFWDKVKYGVLQGITSVKDVQGEFSYDQDVTTTDIYTLNAYYPWNMKAFAGLEPDPEHDGIYEQFEITVCGMVENEKTYTLRELIDTAPHVTSIGTYECEINGYGGPLIESFEFTGIPVSWLIEQSVPTAEANAFKNEYWGGPWSWTYLEKFPSYLVYEINGKPLEYKNGYPVMLYNTNGGAGKCIKNVTRIELIHLEDENAYFSANFGGDGSYKFDVTKTTHTPNVGFCYFTDGMIIPADQPYTFEGYAFADHWGIEAIEFSMDRGNTWTRFDTTESTDGKWLYWNFTWNPPAPGSYVISIRAFDRTGRTFDFANQKLFNVQ